MVQFLIYFNFPEIGLSWYPQVMLLEYLCLLYELYIVLHALVPHQLLLFIGDVGFIDDLRPTFCQEMERVYDVHRVVPQSLAFGTLIQLKSIVVMYDSLLNVYCIVSIHIVLVSGMCIVLIVTKQ